MSIENQNLFSGPKQGSLGERRQAFLKRLGDLCEEKEAWKGRGKALPRRTLVELGTLDDAISLAQYLGSVGEAPIRVTFEVKEHGLRRCIGDSLQELKAEEDAGKPNPMAVMLEEAREAQAKMQVQMMAMMQAMMGGQTPVAPADPVVEAPADPVVEAPAEESPAK
jgi:hypothetical protein